MDKKALAKYLCALLLFGLNGIIASNIALDSYEIVFLRTMIGSVLLIVLFLAGNTWGLFCGAMSAVMYSFMVTLNRKAKEITGLENAVIQLTVSFLAVAVFVGFKQAFVIDVPREAWGWILVLGIVNTGIGCYLYFSPLAKLPVQTVAICGYLEPLSAVVFAALLLGEKMTAPQIVGAVCIIGGAMIGELVKKRNTNSSLS